MAAITSLTQLVTKLKDAVLNPLITLFFVLATVLFMWGVIQYVIGSQGDETKLKNARSLMIWGIVGMAIMASSWGIVKILCDFTEAACAS